MSVSLPAIREDTTREVWKFSLPFPGGDLFWISMPAGAQVLTVQTQHGNPQMWALVPQTDTYEERWFRIAGTGHPITERLGAYIGTFQFADGSLVFHLFEVRP